MHIAFQDFFFPGMERAPLADVNYNFSICAGFSSS